VDLRGLTDAIPVGVNPCTEGVKERVVGIDPTIAITAKLSPVQLGKGTIADFRTVSGKQWRGVAEELLSVVDDPVAIAVQTEECIILAGLRPSDSIETSVSVYVEVNRLIRAGQMKTILLQIKKNRAVFFWDLYLGVFSYRRCAFYTRIINHMKIICVRMSCHTSLIAAIEIAI
jgi:hypothetical protein